MKIQRDALTYPGIGKVLKFMKKKKDSVTIELFYSLTCPNCMPFKRMLLEVLPEFGDKFQLKTTLVSSPVGMIRSMEAGIHSVPTLTIANKIAFRELPDRQSLINQLKLC